jgi:dihydropteroate synthase
MTNQGFQAIAIKPTSPVLSWSWPEVSLGFPPALPYVIGILNITPDSFSDGGKYLATEKAVAHALYMAEAGAAVVDIGGQSTRPGSDAVSPEEEEARVMPVLEALKQARGYDNSGYKNLLVSLDTDKPALAEQALSRSLVDILNDESGGDAAMAAIAANYHVPLILMRRPETSDRGGLAAVMEDLAAIRQRYVKAGLPQDYIAVDPGLGFGMDEDESLAILKDCGKLAELGGPLCVGASRKRVIGKFSGNPEAGRRLGGSLAAALWAAASGVDFIRVHDVKETVEALKMTAAIRGR